jgi:hypothetical protein
MANSFLCRRTGTPPRENETTSAACRCPYNQDGAARVARYELSNAPQEEFPQAILPVGSEDDQICAPFVGGVKNSSSDLVLCDT